MGLVSATLFSLPATPPSSHPLILSPIGKFLLLEIPRSAARLLTALVDDHKKEEIETKERSAILAKETLDLLEPEHGVPPSLHDGHQQTYPTLLGRGAEHEQKYPTLMARLRETTRICFVMQQTPAKHILPSTCSWCKSTCANCYLQ